MLDLQWIKNVGYKLLWFSWQMDMFFSCFYGRWGLTRGQMPPGTRADAPLGMGRRPRNESRCPHLAILGYGLSSERIYVRFYAISTGWSRAGRPMI